MHAKLCQPQITHQPSSSLGILCRQVLSPLKYCPLHSPTHVHAVYQRSAQGSPSRPVSPGVTCAPAFSLRMTQVLPSLLRHALLPDRSAPASPAGGPACRACCHSAPPGTWPPPQPCAGWLSAAHCGPAPAGCPCGTRGSRSQCCAPAPPAVPGHAPAPAGMRSQIVVGHCTPLWNSVLRLLGRVFTLSLLQRLHARKQDEKELGAGNCGRL